MSDEPVVLESKNSRLALWLALSAGLLLAGFIAVLATSDTDGSGSRSPLVGRAAPPIAEQTITGGHFDLDDHRGRWVVVNFFQTNCIPCIEEHPELIEFDQRHREIGDAQLVSIVFSDTAANARSFFEEFGGSWPVLASENTGQYTIRYGVAAAPETFIISPTGVVLAKFEGALTADALDQQLRILSGASA